MSENYSSILLWNWAMACLIFRRQVSSFPSWKEDHLALCWVLWCTQTTSTGVKVSWGSYLRMSQAETYSHCHYCSHSHSSKEAVVISDFHRSGYLLLRQSPQLVYFRNPCDIPHAHSSAIDLLLDHQPIPGRRTTFQLPSSHSFQHSLSLTHDSVLHCNCCCRRLLAEMLSLLEMFAVLNSKDPPSRLPGSPTSFRMYPNGQFVSLPQVDELFNKIFKPLQTSQTPIPPNFNGLTWGPRGTGRSSTWGFHHRG